MTTTTTTTTMMMMKAIQVHRCITDFSNIDATAMTMATNVPRPLCRSSRCRTTGQKPPRGHPPPKQILVRVLACSISPGDVIMVRGNLIFLHRPFPFVPGMDICGVVVAEAEDEEEKEGQTKIKKNTHAKQKSSTTATTTFQPGDIVVASNGIAPVGGLAEYMAVDIREAVHKPAHVDILAAAASSSAITARNAVLDHVRVGDRVLVLGGSGGVGSAALQLARNMAGASFVATTSTQEAMCIQLGADQVINYRIDDWWDMKHYQDKFDVIIDCVGGGNYYGRAPHVLKPGRAGGVFVAVTGDDPQPDCRTVWQAIRFLFCLPWRSIYAWFHRRTLPKYVVLLPYKIPEGRAQVLQWMAEGRLSIPLERPQPYPFTDVGVRAAISKVGSGHAHGKVVVAMQ